MQPNARDVFNHMGYFACLAAVLSAAGSGVRGHVVEPGCKPEDDICRFHLTMEEQFTMVYPVEDTTWLPVTAESDGLRLKHVHNCSRGGSLLSDEEAARVVIGDGHYRKVLAFNGTVPGPPIVVYHGQQVSLKVHNKMRNMATILHIHGIHQRGTPWMDGVDHLSQCPIANGEMFNYRFVADPAGTFWYHSHVGEQFGMGLYGAFIVLPRSQREEDDIRGEDPLPHFDGDYYAMVQDWSRVGSLDNSLLISHGLQAYTDGLDTGVCYHVGRQADGVKIKFAYFHSGVVNGKGWHYPSSTSPPENSHVPLETFVVKKDGAFRFRFISAASAHDFRFSIDGHPLYVIALDGSDVITKEVDSISISPGERYDFFIVANDPQGSGSYWIRFETLGVYDSLYNRVSPSHFEAVLQYEGTSEALPVSKPRHCSLAEPCTVVGLPFSHRPHPSDPEIYTTIPLTSFRATSRNDAIGNSVSEQQEIAEIFLNFAGGTAINGITNMIPRKPLQLYLHESEDIIQQVGCDAPHVEDPAHCFHHYKLPLNSVVDLVLTALSGRTANGDQGQTHVIHIHGFAPSIIDIGFGQNDKQTNFMVAKNPDVRLVPVGAQFVPEWVNASWAGGRKPGMLGASAPRKDTVVIPDGGYVVMRFKADNPGFWHLHCHVDYHAVVGMSLALQVGDTTAMREAPPHMPRCRDFQLTDEEFASYLHGEL